MAMTRQSEERKVSFIRLTVLRVAVVAQHRDLGRE